MKLKRNLGYNVIISPEAKLQLKNIVQYVRFVLKNPIAAKRVLEDAEKTMNKLTYLAKSLKLCEEPELSIHGYRVISFQTHDYVMLYRVDGNTVYVDGIFHQLQNYQELFK
mgnify:CR=1 FL=1